jgi:DNA polymerase-3 subunit gamma/tau
MIVNCAGIEGQDLSVPARHRERMAKQARSLEPDTILAGLDVLASSKARMRGSTHVRVLVEMAVVRLTRLDNLVALTQVAQWLNPAMADSPERRAVPAAQSARPQRLVEPPETAKKKAPATLEPAPEATDGLKSTPAEQPRRLTPDSLPRLWPEILAQSGPIFSAHMEKAGLPAISGPNALALSFPPTYNHQREYCQEASRLARIEDVLRKLTGQAWNVRVESAGETPAEPPAMASTENSLPRNRRVRAEVEQEPLIKRASEVLEARFVHLDEGFGATPVVSVERPDPADGEET